jgi:hypothetical protein
MLLTFASKAVELAVQGVYHAVDWPGLCLPCYPGMMMLGIVKQRG